MVDRMALARKYVQLQRQKRDDIIAAWVGGSVARGEETESSDIDLILMVAGDAGGQDFGSRGATDTWQDGVYIEATLASQSSYADLEEVLTDPFRVTDINYARILYDPTGVCTQLQQQVQAVFMEPQWLGKRLHFWVELAREQVTALRGAVAKSEWLGICYPAGWFSCAYVSVPVLRAGIAPSSTRGLAQLGALSEQSKRRLSAFEGSEQLSSEDVQALEPILTEWLPSSDRPTWGQLPEYFIKKALWFSQQGLTQEALHVMWLMVGGNAEYGRKLEPTAERARSGEPGTIPDTRRPPPIRRHWRQSRAFRGSGRAPQP